jgi:hypothetical protein
LPSVTATMPSFGLMSSSPAAPGAQGTRHERPFGQ